MVEWPLIFPRSNSPWVKSPKWSVFHPSTSEVDLSDGTFLDWDQMTTFVGRIWNHRRALEPSSIPYKRGFKEEKKITPGNIFNLTKKPFSTLPFWTPLKKKIVLGPFNHINTFIYINLYIYIYLKLYFALWIFYKYLSGKASILRINVFFFQIPYQISSS